MSLLNTTYSPSNDRNNLTSKDIINQKPREQYSTLAKFGLWYEYGKAFITFFIILILFYLAYNIFTKTAKTTATVESDTVCSANKSSCKTEISWIVNGKTYKKSIDSFSVYKTKDTVDLYYNKNDPSIVSLTNSTYGGYFLIGIGLITLIAELIRLYFVRNSEIAATGAGVLDIFGSKRY